MLVHSIPPPMTSHTSSRTNAIPEYPPNPSSDNTPVPECKHPVVRLNLDVITDEVAARLATSLLGHVLFLKSQVPFPVAQLSRIPTAKSNTRATKQRSDLLQSFDTLSSHFVTTFTALSTALARRSSECNAPKSDPSELTRRPKDRSRVFLAILVGPSTGSARSKLVLGIDGLETKVWGVRDDAKANSDVEESDSEGAENEIDDDETNDSEDEESDDNGGDVSGDSEDEEHSDNDGSEASPPRSRSPTPNSEPSSSPTYKTYAERQQALNLAERLLARTLAAADAEGNSMAAEMAPTQTHVLLRAPRRFQHPAWIPRQNLSASMESTLDEFLEEPRLPRRDSALEKNRRGQRARVEGVWMTCRDGFGEADVDKWKVGDNEDDEMIWWSWDGKLVGFSEW